jgi:hypothetical protein
MSSLEALAFVLFLAGTVLFFLWVVFLVFRK